MVARVLQERYYAYMISTVVCIRLAKQLYASVGEPIVKRNTKLRSSILCTYLSEDDPLRHSMHYTNNKKLLNSM